MKIGITGCTGRMGQLLVREVEASPALTLAGGTYRDQVAPPHAITVFDDPEALFEVSDIVIDFTSPEASVDHAAIAAKYKTALLIGTTGLSEPQLALIHASARHAPILVSANTSLGVNVLAALVEKAARLLGSDYAIEILEAHHSNKVDAPSGTALALGRAAASGRKVHLADHAVYAREGHTGKRKPDDIGFATLRGGDVVGEHTVFFYGQGERLELTHRATDRALFAKGAIETAKWLAQQPPGFYRMQDFLKVD
jgi:4-hydroxy-tetrahydrodipicolinate reductase